ncbi:hypothetical protein HJG60_008061 [Phyllostomus discolor]|uniref:Uncharacterized protein n=1 Tax=Phyllostomus discolor TaxID=89673 RepID=A0A834BNX2_9CHIR|nr:hypothetical protein HJG60_008061 [Phyllostomus discolor]
MQKRGCMGAGRKCRNEAEWATLSLTYRTDPGAVGWSIGISNTGPQCLGVILATPSGKAFAFYEHQWQDVEQCHFACFLISVFSSNKNVYSALSSGALGVAKVNNICHRPAIKDLTVSEGRTAYKPINRISLLAQMCQCANLGIVSVGPDGRP